MKGFIMESISAEIINALRDGGVDEIGIQRYQEEVKDHPDNLEMISLYWVRKITNLNENIRQHSDILVYLRDNVCSMLWMSHFKQCVVPVIVQKRILS